MRNLEIKKRRNWPLGFCTSTHHLRPLQSYTIKDFLQWSIPKLKVYSIFKISLYFMTVYVFFNTSIMLSKCDVIELINIYSFVYSTFLMIKTFLSWISSLSFHVHLFYYTVYLSSYMLSLMKCIQLLLSKNVFDTYGNWKNIVIIIIIL